MDRKTFSYLETLFKTTSNNQKFQLFIVHISGLGVIRNNLGQEAEEKFKLKLMHEIQIKLGDVNLEIMPFDEQAIVLIGNVADYVWQQVMHVIVSVVNKQHIYKDILTYTHAYASLRKYVLISKNINKHRIIRRRKISSFFFLPFKESYLAEIFFFSPHSNAFLFFPFSK